MNRALYAGLSATAAQQVRMDVTANNLANVNTIGYKGQRTTFEDAFYQTIRSGRGGGAALGGVSPMQVGAGVAVGAISTLNSQGAMQQTGQSLDAAIDGQGMFVVSGPRGVFYTRDGSFGLDDTNTLMMTSSGLKVQGWTANPSGAVNTSAPCTAMVFPLNTMRPPQATSTMDLEGNFTAGATTSQISSVNVYDSLGLPHSVAFSFTPTTSAGEWAATAAFDGGTPAALGLVKFDTNGMYSSGGPLTVTASPAGAAPVSVSVDVAKLTQFVSGGEVAASVQNGYGPAALQSIGITDGGVVQGAYSDGRSMTLGQVALASFANPSGLGHSGNNLFTSGVSSGIAQVGPADTRGRGQVVGQTLEMSNTDLTASFLEMLITQRAYQASTRVISTASTLLDDAIQLAGR